MKDDNKPQKINYNKLSQFQLIEKIKEQDKEIKKLKKIKKFGLVWDEERTKEVFEQKVQDKLPALKEVVKKRIDDDESKPNNILIEGDNYHALSVLNYTHQRKIDLIYIDPPYNTGNNDFIYSDRFVDREDSWRHSKWLSFMNKRLRITAGLLKPDGLIVIHCDENEQAHLHILMNEIFKMNYIGTIVWDKKNPKGDAKRISYQHELIIVYAKNKAEFIKNHDLKRDKENASVILKKAKKYFSQIGKEDYFEDVKDICKKYHIEFRNIPHFKKNKFTLDTINDNFATWMKHQSFSGGEKAYSKINHDGRVYRIASMAGPLLPKPRPSDYHIPLTHPKTKKKCPVPALGWRFSRKRMESMLQNDLIEFGKDETTIPNQKLFLDENLTENIPSVIDFAGNDDRLLKDLQISFAYPKPVKFTKELLKCFLDDDSIVLDFFAGSGTTGHATLQLNKDDGGNRKFILCTNNENNICSDVCYPRLKKVIKGYKNPKDEKVDGLGGNLKYFKTSFIDSKSSDKNKRIMVSQSTEMMCLKEDCFDLVTHGELFKIFKNHNDRYLGIVYDRKGIKSFKKAVLKLNKRINVYVFSLAYTAKKDKFKDVLPLVTLKPIPSAILNTYKKIFVGVETTKSSMKKYSNRSKQIGDKSGVREV